MTTESKPTPSASPTAKSRSARKDAAKLQKSQADSSVSGKTSKDPPPATGERSMTPAGETKKVAEVPAEDAFGSVPALPDAGMEFDEVEVVEEGDAFSELPGFADSNMPDGAPAVGDANFDFGNLPDTPAPADPLSADPLSPDPLSPGVDALPADPFNEGPLAMPAAIGTARPAAATKESSQHAEEAKGSDSPLKNPLVIVVLAGLLVLFIVGIGAYYLLSSHDKVASVPADPGGATIDEDGQSRVVGADRSVNGDRSTNGSSDKASSSARGAAAPIMTGERTAPKGDSAGVKLLEQAEYFALNPETGELAAVQPRSNNLYIYSSEYLATGEGIVKGPIDAGRLPGPVAFKQLPDRAYYVVADLNDLQLRCFDAETLELVHTIQSPCRHNTSISVSRDPTDSRVYFCSNPYPVNTRGRSQYYLCAGDLKSSDPAKVVFHNRNEQPSHCYVSANGNFLYGRRETYPFVAYLQQGQLDQLTESGKFIDVNNDVSFPNIVIDPSGASVACRDVLLTPDMKSAMLKYDFTVQCYLLDRPCVAGFDVNRENPDGFFLKIAGLDSPKVLHNIKTKFQQIPAGLPWHHFYQFSAQASVFHSLASDSIVGAYRDTAFTVSLGELDLPKGPSPLPVIKYPTYVRAGDPIAATLSVPADSDATFSMPELPVGAVLKNNMLSWTPAADQTGTQAMPVKWQSGARSGEVSIKLFIDDASGSLAEDTYTKQEARREGPRSAGSTATVETIVSKRGTFNKIRTANGVAYTAPFPIDEVHAAWDGSAALVLGWDDPKPQWNQRPVDVVTYMAVIDLQSGELQAETDLQMNVTAAAIDGHYVYLKGRGTGRYAPVVVLNRGDLSHKADLTCINTSDFGVFAGRIFVSTHVYAVPSLKIIRTDGRPKTNVRRHPHPPILQNKLAQFYQRNADGWLINGLQYDEARKNVELVRIVDVLGELNVARELPHRGASYGTVHPTLPLVLHKNHQRETAELVVYPEDGRIDDPVKVYPLGASQGRFSGQPEVTEEIVLVPVGGALHEINIRELADLDFPTKSRFIAKQSRLLIDAGQPTTLEYTIEGGKPPYTIGRTPYDRSEQQAVVQDNRVSLTVNVSEDYEADSKRWIAEESKRRAAAVGVQIALTGFPYEAVNPFDNSPTDALIEELKDFCTKKLKVRLPRGVVPVPVKCVLAAKDSEGQSFSIAHWVFLKVKEQDYREKLSGRL